MTTPIRSMPELNIMRSMIEQRWLAAQAHCRIKTWKMTEWEAKRLSEEIADLHLTSPHEMFWMIAAGKVTILGCKVTVLPDDIGAAT